MTLRPRVLVLFCAVALVAFAGCARGSISAQARAQEDGGLAIDTDVMAYLSEARALHHAANLKEDASDLPGALATLEQLVHARKPHETSLVPEVEEVLADTYARMAELRLRQKDVAGAEADARAGLEHAPDPTYFRGHLLEVSGVVEETRATALADAGQTDQAAAARRRALDLLGQAVKVQDQVVTRSLGAATTGGDRGPP
jgi:tetratricopeptide (TPR) repeat protein